MDDPTPSTPQLDEQLDYAAEGIPGGPPPMPGARVEPAPLGGRPRPEGSRPTENPRPPQPEPRPTLEDRPLVAGLNEDVTVREQRMEHGQAEKAQSELAAQTPLKGEEQIPEKDRPLFRRQIHKVKNLVKNYINDFNPKGKGPEWFLGLVTGRVATRGAQILAAPTLGTSLLAKSAITAAVSMGSHAVERGIYHLKKRKLEKLHGNDPTLLAEKILELQQRHEKGTRRIRNFFTGMAAGSVMGGLYDAVAAANPNIAIPKLSGTRIGMAVIERTQDAGNVLSGVKDAIGTGIPDGLEEKVGNTTMGETERAYTGGQYETIERPGLIDKAKDAKDFVMGEDRTLVTESMGGTHTTLGTGPDMLERAGDKAGELGGWKDEQLAKVGNPADGIGGALRHKVDGGGSLLGGLRDSIGGFFRSLTEQPEPVPPSPEQAEQAKKGVEKVADKLSDIGDKKDELRDEFHRHRARVFGVDENFGYDLPSTPHNEASGDVQMPGLIDKAEEKAKEIGQNIKDAREEGKIPDMNRGPDYGAVGLGATVAAGTAAGAWAGKEYMKDAINKAPK